MRPSILLPALVCAAALACSQPPASDPAPAQATPDPDPAASAAPTKPKDPGAWAFEFKDPLPGPRAPTYEAFGAAIGSSRFAEIGKLVESRGLDCGDTSIRAMMDRRREKELKRLDEAKARGEDAVTAASWVNRRSKREANPQVRYSCPKIPADKLTDRKRMPSIGRLLYVFDSADHPLRHASFQRTHQDQAAALADFNDTLAALTKIYGPPTKPLTAELPTQGKDGAVEFPGAVNYEASWEYPDLLVRTNVLRYGKLVTVGERVEVPHGIRPDAPSLRKDAAPSTPAPTPSPATSPATSPAPAAPLDAPAKADPTPAKPPVTPPPPANVPTEANR